MLWTCELVSHTKSTTIQLSSTRQARTLRPLASSMNTAPGHAAARKTQLAKQLVEAFKPGLRQAKHQPALSAEERAVHKHITGLRRAYNERQKRANTAQRSMRGRVNASISALLAETNGQVDKGLLDRLREARVAYNHVRNSWMRRGFKPRPGAILQTLTEAARVVEESGTACGEARNRDLLAANPGLAMMAYRLSFEAAQSRLQWRLSKLLQELGSGKVTVESTSDRLRRAATEKALG